MPAFVSRGEVGSKLPEIRDRRRSGRLMGEQIAWDDRETNVAHRTVILDGQTRESQHG